MSLLKRRIPGALLGLLIAVGCGGKELHSQWRDREVEIDGYSVEWDGAVTYLKDDKASVGLLNDENAFYVSFVVNDPALQRQILGRGTILTFKTEGDGEDLSIRYPLGILETPGLKQPTPEERPSLDELIAVYQTTDAELEIIRGSSDALRLRILDVEGISVALGSVQGSLIYELKVPLGSGGPNAIDAEPGAKIDVQFKTPQIDMDALREQMMAGGGGRGSRGGGGGGRGGSGMGGPPTGEMGMGLRDLPDPIDVSATVVLAVPSQPAKPLLEGGD